MKRVERSRAGRSKACCSQPSDRSWECIPHHNAYSFGLTGGFDLGPDLLGLGTCDGLLVKRNGERDAVGFTTGATTGCPVGATGA